MRRDFYVDDGLKSVKDVVPPSNSFRKRKTCAQRLALNDTSLVATRRSTLDPSGQTKLILQDLWRNYADWDEPICDELRPRWERWRGELHTLESLRIPRCFKPEGFGQIKTVDLHHFSNASLSGYGQCSYLRLISERDQTHCSLVMGKARVTPLKPVTIPRLELTAAVVSVKISQWLGEELDYQDVSEFFWTDSKVVTGYISHTTSRFHVFVANRLQQIHDHTKPQQWQCISSQSNPADAAATCL
ncbi:PREDICTED: uncharacterized protein LOC107358601 [Acropora digitifera]|uniref:uncharacterized protein LOC107358601 n=1 Tax=Acropora digitifera TaxID=70779 RepID=UPI00077AA5FE|nr:PREDICTED: uncharacterized protein LOC107358601 [Acropora digitifera]